MHTFFDKLYNVFEYTSNVIHTFFDRLKQLLRSIQDIIHPILENFQRYIATIVIKKDIWEEIVQTKRYI